LALSSPPWPDPQNANRRWLVIGGALIAALCLCALALTAVTAWGIWDSVQKANALAGAQANATATVQAAIVNPPIEWTRHYVDTFSPTSNLWDLKGSVANERASGDFDVNGGEYDWHVYANSPVVWWSTPSLPSQGDFIFKVDADHISGPTDNVAYGVIYRYQSGRNYSMFVVSEDGYFAIEKLANGNWSSLQDWTQSHAINSESPNRLIVSASGGRFWFVVNDQVVAQLDDPTPAQGSFGLVVSVRASDTDLRLVFDNLELYAP